VSTKSSLAGTPDRTDPCAGDRRGGLHQRHRFPGCRGDPGAGGGSGARRSHAQL